MRKNLSRLINLLLLGLACCLGIFSVANAMGDKPKKPTVIVVDADTGAPIEGAVAIAIWRKHSSSKRAWWEGGTTVVSRVEEAVSDKDGRIFIPDYWSWRSNAHLTIYKFGYVCWDQKYLFGKIGGRSDFDKKNRIARLEKWPEEFSYERHDDFIRFVTQRESPIKSIFRKEYRREAPLAMRERNQKRNVK